MTTYEHALNDHIRICLQFEHLMRGIRFYLGRGAEWDHKVCLDLLVNLLDLLDRSDLRSRFSQELHRYSITLNRLAHNPNINERKLEQTLSEIQSIQQLLHKHSGKFMRGLRDDDFIIKAIKFHRNPGGICPISQLEIQHWIKQGREKRLEQLEPWVESFDEIGSICTLILDLVRNSGVSQKHVAEQGYFDMVLDSTRSNHQLLQVKLLDNSKVYPQISFGRHGLSIHFTQQKNAKNIPESVENIEFELTCCAF